MAHRRLAARRLPVVLAAQFKARKTTLVGNLVRSLVDGDYWLDKHEVAPVSGTLAVLDFEMGVDQLDDWLRDQRIRDDDRGLVIPKRGRAALFDLLAQRKLAEWAKLLRDQRHRLSRPGLPAADPRRPRARRTPRRRPILRRTRPATH